MTELLEGGCRVTGFKDGEPTVNGTLSVWPQLGRANGASAISLRTMEFASGLSPRLNNDECDEILYVLQGAATVQIDGNSFEVEPQMGIYLRPGTTLVVDNPNPDPLVLISSQCPEPSVTSDTSSALPSANAGTAQPLQNALMQQPPIVKLSDRQAVATADRWFRVLVDDEIGSEQATQFVGSIPRGRAPDHCPCA